MHAGEQFTQLDWGDEQIELIIIHHALAARMDVTGVSQGYPYSLHGCPTKLPLHATTGVPQLKLPIHITAGVLQSYGYTSSRVSHKVIDTRPRVSHKVIDTRPQVSHKVTVTRPHGCSTKLPFTYSRVSHKFSVTRRHWCPIKLLIHVLTDVPQSYRYTFSRVFHKVTVHVFTSVPQC